MKVESASPFLLLILILCSCSDAEDQRILSMKLVGTWVSEIEVRPPSITDSTAILLSEYPFSRGIYGLAGVYMSQYSADDADGPEDPFAVASQALVLEPDGNYRTIWTLVIPPQWENIGVKEEGTWNISGSSGLVLTADEIWPDVWDSPWGVISSDFQKTKVAMGFLNESKRTVLYVDSISDDNLYVGTGLGVHFKFESTTLEEHGINRPWK